MKGYNVIKQGSLRWEATFSCFSRASELFANVSFAVQQSDSNVKHCLNRTWNKFAVVDLPKCVLYIMDNAYHPFRFPDIRLHISIWYCLFDSLRPINNFQLNRDESSWVEPALS